MRLYARTVLGRAGVMLGGRLWVSLSLCAVPLLRRPEWTLLVGPKAFLCAPAASAHRRPEGGNRAPVATAHCCRIAPLMLASAQARAMCSSLVRCLEVATLLLVLLKVVLGAPVAASRGCRIAYSQHGVITEANTSSDVHGTSLEIGYVGRGMIGWHSG